MQYQSTKHVAVIVAGLGGLENFPTLTSSWAKYGIETVHFKPMWKSAESFENKLGRFLGFIDLLVSQGKTVSLVGTSAGGSMVVNAFIERRKIINTVVVVCGWITVGKNSAIFDKLRLKAPSFVESVSMCDDRIELLTLEDRSKIMTISSVMDELVPSEVSRLEGAKNIKTLIPIHVVAILFNLALAYRKIIDFILDNSNTTR
ncbi:MAG: hypothetical protein A2566_03600 [Candidatus Zambryskibacteria bacterium RIFOXYD1_FULL_40_13]|nr:MAG: hypothetical protein UT25_C0002G0196 [Parcubacteria group bacterium GW2011_GWC1_39_12]KKR19304.1 MAG: hypothetical protein UT49_C0002G0150 [Parcubacteria group bacterium GW2011_GWF1_39_37]KKR35313.1 MAG: hypothetical protein UT68_C0004G0121 [Parcubacteria group bacterium GW2011_GWC2_40_10]KKR52255.1 MAG: hypothetical protein UT89_C0002G0056 [Parcubacteria group bacterium GW2011_GWE1_40_20]KKR69297.1 MAG: hypothetical protein UU11_C0002G0095 [Parcubacteria group bacterium GW2011_GWF2_40_